MISLHLETGNFLFQFFLSLAFNVVLHVLFPELLSISKLFLVHVNQRLQLPPAIIYSLMTVIKTSLVLQSHIPNSADVSTWMFHRKASTPYIQKLKYYSSPNMDLFQNSISLFIPLLLFIQSPKLKSKSSYPTTSHSPNLIVTESYEFYLLNICVINLILRISTDTTFV